MGTPKRQRKAAEKGKRKKREEERGTREERMRRMIGKTVGSQG